MVVKPFHPYDIQYCVWTALLNNFSTSEEDKDSQNKFCMVIRPDGRDRETMLGRRSGRKGIYLFDAVTEKRSRPKD